MVGSGMRLVKHQTRPPSIAQEDDVRSRQAPGFAAAAKRMYPRIPEDPDLQLDSDVIVLRSFVNQAFPGPGE